MASGVEPKLCFLVSYLPAQQKYNFLCFFSKKH